MRTERVDHVLPARANFDVERSPKKDILSDLRSLPVHQGDTLSTTTHRTAQKS